MSVDAEAVTGELPLVAPVASCGRGSVSSAGTRLVVPVVVSWVRIGWGVWSIVLALSFADAGKYSEIVSDENGRVAKPGSTPVDAMLPSADLYNAPSVAAEVVVVDP